jgi:membrane associated rhomboid family serine protease
VVVYLLSIGGGSLLGGPTEAIAAFVDVLFLAIFGPAVEDAVGRLRFTAFYLLGGLIALVTQVLLDPGSTAPELGASGAIAAVLGGYVALHPRARVLTVVFVVFFVTLIEIPALALVGLWFLVELTLGLTGAAGSAGAGQGFACLALAGGFALVLLAIRLFARRRNRDPTAATGVLQAMDSRARDPV